MKKLLLLFSTLLCINALTGMERIVQEYKVVSMDMQIRQFTALVHALAKKFNVQPYGTIGFRPYAVAKAFKTPIAQKYCTLCEKLQDSLLSKRQDMQTITELIAQGADVNCLPMLGFAVSNKNPKAALIQLLLDHGANPFFENLYRETALEVLNENHQNVTEYEAIKILLENAMRKQQELDLQARKPHKK